MKTVIDRALALASDLPDAHLALGYYLYWGFRRYDEAVTEFQRTLQLAPNGADALAGLAFIARRKGGFNVSSPARYTRTRRPGTNRAMRRRRA